MDQLSRLISVLTLLKSKRILTATELSERYDVSIRTVYRDIKKLIDAGVPVITIEGRGYSLMDGYTVAPVQFSEKEANALITAQNLVMQTQDSSFAKNFDDALTKIKSVFRQSILEGSEKLDDKIYVFQNNLQKLESNALLEMQLAIIHFRRAEINYQKGGDTEITFRKIEPLGLYATQNKWILIAYCHLRKADRAFRMDRIKHFKILDEHFEDPKFSLRTYFKEDDYEGPVDQ